MSNYSPAALHIDGTGLRIGIVAARFNQSYVDALLEGVLSSLRRAGVSEERIRVERVPGSNELPVVARYLAEDGRFDAVVALGVVLAGGTRHFEMVADSANYGLQKVALETGVPVVSGLVVGATEELVRERCVGSLAKGPDFGQCALEMALMRRKYC